MDPILLNLYKQGIEFSHQWVNAIYVAEFVVLYPPVSMKTEFSLIQEDILKNNWISEDYLVLNVKNCWHIVFSKK